jgi:hypothetical protein
MNLSGGPAVLPASSHDKQRIVGGRSFASCPLPEGTIDKNLGTL